MFGKSVQPGFPRRVVTSYLLFCMLAVAWLTMGVLTTSQSLVSNRATGVCLASLGRLAAAIEIDQLRFDGEHIQQLVEQANAEGRLAYCCIVSEDGRYLAHSTRPLVGAPVVEPSGKQLRWGNIDGVQYAGVGAEVVNEYRVDLNANSRPIGKLRLAVYEPNFFTILGEVAEAAPLGLLLPLLFVGCGAVFLGRMVQPLATVEDRLKEILQTPEGQPLKLTRVGVRSPATAGWNRLAAYVDTLQASPGGHSLDDRLAEAVAMRGDRQSEKILQSLREGIAVTDAEGRINFANAAIASLLDEETSAMAEHTLLESIEQAAKDTTPLRNGHPQTPLVTEIETSGGSGARYLRVERLPLEDEAQTGHVWSLRDITQQRLAEASRDQFIDAATHELRTPLANIKAYAETLATCDFSDPEQQKDFCNTINTEATRLARFVDDLLDISSMEIGSLSAQRQNVDVERMLREAATKIQPLLKGKSIHFECTLAPKLGEMRIDKDKVSAMVVNLLGNAAKYTPAGGEVKLQAAATNSLLKIDITDTGLGISNDELPKVFEKFFRSENPAVAEQTGTGLGLPLAREIARMHGGDITATSSLGEGSTFTITLPRGEGDHR